MKLSIITINYNNLDGLKKTAESIINQTWQDYEWIIIDGGSNDGSKEYVERVVSMPNSKVSYWCSEPDKGIYNAMNKGIISANGDYLNFMNSGDSFYANDTLTKVFELPFDEDIIVGYNIGLQSGKIDRLYSKEYTPLKILLNYNFCQQALFIKREFQLQELYDETLRIISDWKFYLLACTKYNANFKFIDMIVAVMDNTGISSTSPTLVHEEKKVVYESVFGKEIADELIAYNVLVSHKHIKDFEYLRNNSKFGFVFCRRILSLVTKVVRKL